MSSIDGNSAAFSKLSEHVREIAYSYFLSKHHLKKIINLEDVEDLTNNVYLTFAEQYHNVENIENWLRRVLFLTFIKWYKRNKLTSSYELNNNIATDGNHNRTADILDTDIILKLLDSFSDEKQKIIKLRFWGDLKFHEIAEKMHKSEVAVKKMFYRTIAEIKIKLK
ncbi:RNA polymerase sigma factor SigX [bacterium BMS3Abin03]|nr:RNA polymerase sigma factor SigX [bacterium BMS3Abin03]